MTKRLMVLTGLVAAGVGCATHPSGNVGMNAGAGSEGMAGQYPGANGSMATAAPAETAPPRGWLSTEQGDYTTVTRQEVNQEMGQTGAQGSRELNASPQLERDLSGDYHVPQTQQGVGAPPATQRGVNDPDAPGRELFRNNRAQGVGSAATGNARLREGNAGLAETGQSTTQGEEQSNSGNAGDDQLAQRVKETLVNNSTGTFGVTSPDMRQLNVTSRDGTIILQGSVPTQKDKDIIEIRTREMRGVRGVNNQLTVSGQQR